MYALFTDVNQLIKLPQENMPSFFFFFCWKILIALCSTIWFSLSLFLTMKLQCKMKIIQQLVTDVLLTWWAQSSEKQGMN